MRQLVVSALLILLGCTGLVSISRVFGSVTQMDQDSYLALLLNDLQGKDQIWCWRGVCPGVDSFEEAEQKAFALSDGEAVRLVSNYDRMVLWESNNPTLWRVWLETRTTLTRIQLINIEPEPHVYRDFFKPTIGSRQITLGMLMLQFGVPTLVAAGDAVQARSRLIVCFERQVCAEMLPAQRLSPTQWVDHITLQGSERTLYLRGANNIRSWRGMINILQLFRRY